MPFLKSAIGTSRSFPGTFSFRARAREDRARGESVSEMRSQLKAGIPVCARPRIKAWIS